MTLRWQISSLHGTKSALPSFMQMHGELITDPRLESKLSAEENMSQNLQSYGQAKFPAWCTSFTTGIAFLATIVLFGGCASNPYPPAPGTLESVDYNYHIGPSDIVNVIVWRNP